MASLKYPLRHLLVQAVIFCVNSVLVVLDPHVFPPCDSSVLLGVWIGCTVFSGVPLFLLNQFFYLALRLWIHCYRIVPVFLGFVLIVIIFIGTLDQHLLSYTTTFHHRIFFIDVRLSASFLAPFWWAYFCSKFLRLGLGEVIFIFSCSSYIWHTMTNLDIVLPLAWLKG